MTDKFRTASEPTIRRLPQYRRLLLKFQAASRKVVSCTHIANELKLDPTQVRKNLSATGIVGRPRVGYDIVELIESIENFLGWNNTHDAFLVGTGSLGRALLGYDGFSTRGLNIVAAFDTDPAIIGQRFHGKHVVDYDKFSDLAQRMHVKIGIIATPAAVAQQVATLMVLSGIRAIWNFAPANLEVPDGVIIEDVDLSGSLAVLSSKLTEALKNGT